jgi:hypothetical protein
VSERALSAGGSGYEDFVGLLSVIAIELLQVTYLHRTQPDAPAQEILNPVQLKVLKAASPSKLPKILTVAWAVETVAYLGAISNIVVRLPLVSKFCGVVG